MKVQYVLLQIVYAELHSFINSIVLELWNIRAAFVDLRFTPFELLNHSDLWRDSCFCKFYQSGPQNTSGGIVVFANPTKVDLKTPLEG